ncbi:MAG: hypothetical protein D6706_06225 [Chloroflexi bacterium]|nr:MAG: hypothetical protein D6706_06225 [Chloroflexota bacterium]
MRYMVMLVLDNLNQCPSVLDAWESTGVRGITILESTGLAKVKGKELRDDLPLMPGLTRLLRGQEQRHRTIFTVVESEEDVDRIIEATESVIGDLNLPHNGVLFVLPVVRMVGGQASKKFEEEETK